MGKIKLYIATSLDGKIARANGDVSWLDEIAHPENEDYGYHEFYNSIGITLMGNKTYQQVLSFGVEFPYKGKSNFVFTRNGTLEDDENVSYISEDILSFVKSLREQKEDVWLIGGGEVIAVLLDNKLVDELIIHIMPVLLGEGIPLIGKLQKDIPLHMSRSKNYENGVIELNYEL